MSLLQHIKSADIKYWNENWKLMINRLFQICHHVNHLESYHFVFPKTTLPVNLLPFVPCNHGHMVVPNLSRPFPVVPLDVQINRELHGTMANNCIVICKQFVFINIFCRYSLLSNIRQHKLISFV